MRGTTATMGGGKISYRMLIAALSASLYAFPADLITLAVLLCATIVVTIATAVIPAITSKTRSMLNQGSFLTFFANGGFFLFRFLRFPNQEFKRFRPASNEYGQ